MGLFAFPHAYIQLDRHHLLKILCCFSFIILDCLSKLSVHKCVDLLLDLQFDSIDQSVHFNANSVFYYHFSVV